MFFGKLLYGGGGCFFISSGSIDRLIIFCGGNRIFYFFYTIFVPRFGYAGRKNIQTGYKEEKNMQQLKERILRDGKCFEGGILKVDNFINHQMDPILMKSMAVEFVRRFASRDINKILTIEASGIAPAIMVGYLWSSRMVFAQEEEIRARWKYVGDESLFVYQKQYV